MKRSSGTFLAVQWLRLCASTAWGVSLIPGWVVKIPHSWMKPQENLLKPNTGNFKQCLCQTTIFISEYVLTYEQTVPCKLH